MDPAGGYLAFAPPGDYTVTVTGVGYEPATATARIREDGGTRLDLSLTRAGTGRTVPGPHSQARATDIVLSNGLLSLAVSADSEDPQLSPVTLGKPLDLAAVGHLDQIDWLNLPYASATQPRGSGAWRQRTVRPHTVEVVAAMGPVAVARGAGVSMDVPGIDVVTTYSIRQGEPWVTAESAFTNRGTAATTLWAGDVMDHDGVGQRSGVAGHGTITASAPADFTPAEPWIGMTGV